MTSTMPNEFESIPYDTVDCLKRQISIDEWGRALVAASNASGTTLFFSGTKIYSQSWEDLISILGVKMSDFEIWTKRGQVIPDVIIRKVKLLAGPNGEFIAKMMLSLKK